MSLSIAGVLLISLPIGCLGLLLLIAMVISRIENDIWYEFWENTPVTEGASSIVPPVRLETKFSAKEAA